jgi:hypothetical protein
MTKTMLNNLFSREKQFKLPSEPIKRNFSNTFIY